MVVGCYVGTAVEGIQRRNDVGGTPEPVLTGLENIVVHVRVKTQLAATVLFTGDGLGIRISENCFWVARCDIAFRSV